MKKSYLMFFVLLYYGYCVQAQELDPYKFFPLKKGNYWTYSSNGGKHIYSTKIFADSAGNNSMHFFWITPYGYPNYPDYGLDIKYYLWLAPLNSFYPVHYYKLDAIIGEWWRVSRRDPTETLAGRFATVDTIYDGYFLGKKTIFKEIAFYTKFKMGNDYWEVYQYKDVLAYNIGKVYSEGDNDQEFLVGAIIDGEIIGTPVSVEEHKAEILPQDFQLYQNYPNPFNPITTIKYEIPARSFVRLKIFDCLGQEITSVINEEKEAGTYSVKFDGKNLPSGVYFYSLITNNQLITKKMLLIK